MVTAEDVVVEESSAPAVSWAAVIGGALAATGVTLILWPSALAWVSLPFLLGRRQRGLPSG